ncbi:MAG TPA: hypothetical protein VFJ58_11725 [Armatimonadota bacterium]|nr:hypothetical protein [Armatimonadota bacterium]
MNKVGVIGVAAAIIAGSLAAGCTQNDVHNADTAFHQVAQGTHNVGQKMAHEADKAGQKISSKANEAGQKMSNKANEAGHKINQKVKSESKPGHD